LFLKPYLQDLEAVAPNKEWKLANTVYIIPFAGYVYVVSDVRHPKKTTLPGGEKWTTDMNKAEIPLEATLRWEWIKYQLRANGTSLAKLARALEVSGSAVKNARRTAYPRMERAIAKALELKPIDIWPERWNANGSPQRIRTQRAEKNTICGQEHNSVYVLGQRKTGTEC
jgi:Ner family transcriptional regulator